MSPLPNHRPDRSSLSPLEAEIMQLVWELHPVTVKDIHERLLSDPDRELTYSSVTTVLRRLTHKGWLVCDATGCTLSRRFSVYQAPRLERSAPDLNWLVGPALTQPTFLDSVAGSFTLGPERQNSSQQVEQCKSSTVIPLGHLT